MSKEELKKYTVSTIFPNEEIMNDALNRKSADEMFLELGFEKDENKHYIHYIKNDTFRRICFIKRNQRVETIMPFTVQELKAINEKCRELGWL